MASFTSSSWSFCFRPNLFFSEFLFHLMDEIELLHLPQWRKGQHGPHNIVLGDLEVGELVIQEFPYFLARGGFTRLGHYVRPADLAPFFVRASDDRRQHDVRVFADGVLDLGGVDVFAAADEHFLFPSHYHKGAVFLEFAHVTRVEVTIFIENLGVLLGPPPVTLHHLWPLDADLPNPALRQ